MSKLRLDIERATDDLLRSAAELIHQRFRPPRSDTHCERGAVEELLGIAEQLSDFHGGFWRTTLEELTKERLIHSEEEMAEFHRSLIRSLIVLQGVCGCYPEISDEVEPVLQRCRRIHEHLAKDWPWRDEQRIARSIAAYQRGEGQDVRGIICDCVGVEHGEVFGQVAVGAIDLQLVAASRR